MDLDLARKFTDIEYLSKYELTVRMQNNLIEPLWDKIVEYRQFYKQIISLKMIERIPFYIILTPLILNKLLIVEKQLIEYIKIYYKQSDKEKVFHSFISDEKVSLEKFKNNENIKHNEVEYKKTIDNYFLIVEKLFLEKLEILNSDLVSNFYFHLSMQEEESSVWRKNEIDDATSTLVIGKVFTGANPNRISEHLEILTDFIENNHDFSPLAKSIIGFVYFKYIIPLKNNNEEISFLYFLKLLSNTGANEAAYIIPIIQSFNKYKDNFLNAMNNSKKSGDLTYLFLQTLKIVEVSIDFIINKLKLPQENKTANISTENLFNEDKEKTMENNSNKKFDEEIKLQSSNEELLKEKTIATSNIYLKYEEILEDKEVLKPLLFNHVNKRLNNFIQENTQTNEVEKDESTMKNTPPLKVKPTSYIRDLILDNELIDLDKISHNDLVQHLIELHPTMKYSQARFLVFHRIFGKYYTIGQFKKFNNCAYETARTSMENIVNIGYYKRERIGNKFIYTPIK